MTFTPVESQSRTVGPYTIVYLRPDQGTEGGHEVRWPYQYEGETEQRIRVLPDGHTSGQRRSRSITEACSAAAEAQPDHMLAMLVGHLSLAGLNFEVIDTSRDPLEQYLTDWLLDSVFSDGAALIRDLTVEGYQITRLEDDDTT